MSATAPESANAPWQFFASHRSAPFPFFVDRGKSGRLSFAGSRPCEQLVIDADGNARIWRAGHWQRESADPVDCIAAFVAHGRTAPIDAPAFVQGHVLPRTVGFLSYGLGRWADGPKGSPQGKATSDATPLAVLSTYDAVDVWDSSTSQSATIRFVADPCAPSADALEPLATSPWRNTTREAYGAGFARIREAIACGEIYQANLSRRAVFALNEAPADAYARLREVQPMPWGAFLDFGGFALLSNSPECFVVRNQDRVFTQPIKGTRPRHSDPKLDADERESLVRDPKEMAEHLMIVDLERNDLGRVARTGSVQVTRLAGVESFATVHHMVSDVEARLRDGVGVAELLRATFPGGSITGAPKIRAMQILAEVEEDGRGPYTGAIGFFNGEHEVELSIAIRTAVASGGRALYSTGGGIVADSDKDREWAETELKLAAFTAALASGAAQSATITSATSVPFRSAANAAVQSAPDPNAAGDPQVPTREKRAVLAR